MDVKCADVHPIYFCPSVLFFSRRTFVYSFSEQFCFSLHYGSRGQLRFTRERKITMLIINSAWVGLVSVRVMLVPRILLVKIYFHSQSPKHNRNSCLNFCTRKNNIYTKSLFVILFLKFNSIQSDITNKCLVSLYILWKDLYFFWYFIKLNFILKKRGSGTWNIQYDTNNGVCSERLLVRNIIFCRFNCKRGALISWLQTEESLQKKREIAKLYF